MATDPKQLKQVFQHIQRIKASDYAVIVGSHDEGSRGYRIAEQSWKEFPEPSTLASLIDAWLGIERNRAEHLA